MRRARSTWVAWAAAGWMVLFGLMSCAWGAGLLLGSDTLGVEIDRLARERDGGFVLTLWATGIAKLLAALLPVALATGWPSAPRAGSDESSARRVCSGEPRARRAIRRATLLVGGAMTLYGLANLVQHALMQLRAIDVPAGLGGHAVPWHLALWDPFWLLGGVLYLGAARLSLTPPARAAS
ncbi:MAG TPA: DUF3995 domain-containing protein [Conexibacter sp.]|nr:DUF3995 domain-containing protein [Conexibacter sp.]